MSERLKETVAIAMVGDGLLALVEPERHVRLWNSGPGLWRSAMDPFEKRPMVTRATAVAQVGLGLWLASRQRA
ncbi:MAG: hypothetical protein R6X25_15190 [Candidatus Krumholzibacteriia bacterium]